MNLFMVPADSLRFEGKQARPAYLFGVVFRVS